MNRLWPVLLPELRAFPEAERDAALRAARRAELDMLELLAMMAGFVAVTALTCHALPDAAAPARLLIAVWNFLVAMPLLAIALGPFHLRRMRRGLREQLEQRGRH